MGGLISFKFCSIFVEKKKNMKDVDRITFNANMMGSKPCIRRMCITVGTIVGLVASSKTTEEILQLYPYIEQPYW